jgi:hypothetical protein
MAHTYRNKQIKNFTPIIVISLVKTRTTIPAVKAHPLILVHGTGTKDEPLVLVVDTNWEGLRPKRS